MDIHNLKLNKFSSILITYYNNLYDTYKSELKLPTKISKKYYNFQYKIYNLLKNIYSDIKLEYKNLDNFRKIYQSENKDNKIIVKNILNEHFEENKFVSDDIINYIKTTDFVLINYNFIVNQVSINIKFFIYISHKISKKEINLYDKYGKHILAMIKLISNLCLNKCSNNGLDISIFLTPFKRVILNSDKEIIGSKNANGGFCYGCQKKGEIFIYREEDFMKVLAHELIHNYGLDIYIFEFMKQANKHNSKEAKIYKEFINNFNLSDAINENNFDIGIQEALIEFWGMFINISIYAYNFSEYNLNSYNDKYFVYLNTVENIYNIERIHSLLQVIKILDKNNLKYIDILSKYRKTFERNNYKEETHVFSYYILKLFLIYDYSKFIVDNISVTNGKDVRLYFNNSIKNMEDFMNYMKKVSNNRILYQSLVFTEKVYENLNSYIDKNKTKDKTKDIIKIRDNFKMVVIEF